MKTPYFVNLPSYYFIGNGKKKQTVGEFVVLINNGKCFSLIYTTLYRVQLITFVTVHLSQDVARHKIIIIYKFSLCYACY